MEAKAVLRNSPHSYQKMRMVADNIRKQPVERALHILKLHPKRMYSRQLEKLLLSAISNWESKEENEGLDIGDLYVKEIRVDQGPKLKRVRFASQGRVHRIRKHFNHVHLTIDTPEEYYEEDYDDTDDVVTDTDNAQQTDDNGAEN